MIYSSMVLLLNDVDPNFRHQANKQAWLKRRWIPEGAISDWRDRQFKTYSSVLAFNDNRQTSENSVCHACFNPNFWGGKNSKGQALHIFLASQDVPEVMFISDWYDSGEWWYLLQTWLIVLMLMLSPLAVPPGVTHLWAYHCPLDSQCCLCCLIYVHCILHKLPWVALINDHVALAGSIVTLWCGWLKISKSCCRPVVTRHSHKSSSQSQKSDQAEKEDSQTSSRRWGIGGSTRSSSAGRGLA